MSVRARTMVLGMIWPFHAEMVPHLQPSDFEGHEYTDLGKTSQFTFAFLHS